MAVAFELQNGVDNVFQHLRTGNGSFFGDVTHEHYGGVACFGKFEQSGSAFANLGDRTGRGVDTFNRNGLYGVDYHQIGGHFAYVAKHLVELRFA